MTALSWAILGVLVVTAALLGWRYYILARTLRRYAEALRRDQRTDDLGGSVLRGVPGIVRGLLADARQQRELIVGERDRLAAVLDQLSDGVLIANSMGEIRYANPAASHIFQSSEVLEKSVTEVLRDHRLVEAWRRSRETSAMQSESVELPGRRQFIQLIVAPDMHGGGSLILAQDLTRVRRLETVRQDFVSNFSHELRTPLASLKALAETLQQGALRDPEAAPRFLQQMIAEVDSLAQMSQELLDLTAIESGKAILQLAPTDPCRLLQSGAERMRLQAERAGITLHVTCPESLPAVNADAARLGQVLLNLIHNALKFTPRGGQVTLSARRWEGPTAGGLAYLEFSIHDSGHGISAEDLPRIFERFYRGDRARLKGGTGMGLSIARHLVDSHGGRIWAESVEGSGSTFRFTIPCQP